MFVVGWWSIWLYVIHSFIHCFFYSSLFDDDDDGGGGGGIY